MQRRNAQPFYHRIDGLLFTSTTGCTAKQFTDVFIEFTRSRIGRELGIVPESITIEEYQEPEAGDPADI